MVNEVASWLIQFFWCILWTCVAGALGGLVCGSAAGVCAKVVVYPMDLVKKRLQIQGFEYGNVVVGANRKYRSFIHCMRQIVAYEGVSALYKGFGPSLLKALVTTGLHFSMYEHSLLIIRRIYFVGQLKWVSCEFVLGVICLVLESMNCYLQFVGHCYNSEQLAISQECWSWTWFMYIFRFIFHIGLPIQSIGII